MNIFIWIVGIVVIGLVSTLVSGPGGLAIAFFGGLAWGYFMAPKLFL